MATIQTRYFLVQSWASKVSKGTQARDSLPNCPAIGPLGHAGTEPELRWQNYVPSSERKQTVQDSWVPRYHTPALGTTFGFPNTTPTLNLSLQVQLGSRRGKGWDVGGCLQVLGHSREDTCSTSNSQASLCLPSRSPSALAGAPTLVSSSLSALKYPPSHNGAHSPPTRSPLPEISHKQLLL